MHLHRLLPHPPPSLLRTPLTPTLSHYASRRQHLVPPFARRAYTTSPPSAPGPLYPHGRLHDKICIVTGSSSGLGRAISLLFAREGARLVVCADLSPAAKSTFQAEEAGVSTHELICSRYGEGRGAFVLCDVTRAVDVERCVKEAVERSGELEGGRGGGGGEGRLDVMVNNAGIGGTEGHGQVHEMEEATWDGTMAANSKGAFLGCKYAIQQFLRQEPLAPTVSRRGMKGWIVNTSSIMGLVGQKVNGAAYCASKGAVMLLTKSVGVAYAKEKIVCNALCPGHLKTPMTEGQYKDQEMRRQISSLYPDPEDWGTAEDVARAAVFLASEDAGFVTGVGLPVDGGTGSLGVARTVLNWQNVTSDPTWLVIPNWYIRTWEVIFGVVAACVPTLRPGYKWLMGELKTQYSRRKSSGRTGSGQTPLNADKESVHWHPPKPTAFVDDSKVSQREKVRRTWASTVDNDLDRSPHNSAHMSTLPLQRPDSDNPPTPPPKTAIPPPIHSSKLPSSHIASQQQPPRRSPTQAPPPSYSPSSHIATQQQRQRRSPAHAPPSSPNQYHHPQLHSQQMHAPQPQRKSPIPSNAQHAQRADQPHYPHDPHDGHKRGKDEAMHVPGDMNPLPEHGMPMRLKRRNSEAMVGGGCGEEEVDYRI